MFEDSTITVEMTQQQFIALLARYKELDKEKGPKEPGTSPYDLDIHLTHIDTERIDADYLDAKYTKYVRALEAGLPQTERNELCQTSMLDLSG